MGDRRAAILGTGLIGASVGVALRAERWWVSGWDPDPAHLEEAGEIGAFDRAAASQAEAIEGADLVVLTDIYASGTVPIPGITGKLIVNAVTEADPDRRVVWLPRREDLIAFLAEQRA